MAKKVLLVLWLIGLAGCAGNGKPAPDGQAADVGEADRYVPHLFSLLDRYCRQDYANPEALVEDAGRDVRLNKTQGAQR